MITWTEVVESEATLELGDAIALFNASFNPPLADDSTAAQVRDALDAQCLGDALAEVEPDSVGVTREVDSIDVVDVHDAERP
jgi:hypothetical protein